MFTSFIPIIQYPPLLSSSVCTSFLQERGVYALKVFFCDAKMRNENLMKTDMKKAENVSRPTKRRIREMKNRLLAKMLEKKY